MVRKALFFDIDGTLIDIARKIYTIPQSVRVQMRRLQDAGYACFLCSGRVRPMLNDDLLSAGFDGFVLGNGAHVELGGQSIHEEHMAYETTKTLCRILREGDVQYMLQTAHHVYLDRAYTTLAERYAQVGDKNFFTQEYDEDEVMRRTIKVETWEPQDVRERMTGLLRAALGQSVSIDGNGTNRAFEAYSAEVSKAKGVRVACAALGITERDAIAFGDGQNDVEMFRACGTSVAMGNAEEVAKQAADVVCDTIERDGLARALADLL